MIIYPCNFKKNGINYMYSMCSKDNVNQIVAEMNERLHNKETGYNGLKFEGIEFFFAGEPYDEDMSLWD